MTGRRRVRKGRLLGVILVVALVVGGCTAGVSRLLGGNQLADEPVTVEVVEGMGAGGVGDLLAEEGVIRNASLFKLQARMDERASQIRPGTYEFQPGASFDEILTALTAAPSEAPAFTVTIPEGLNVDQTLQRIVEAEGSPFRLRQLRRALNRVALPAWVPKEVPEGGEFYEGMLFPSTYEFLRDASATDLLARLVDQTQTVMESLDVPAEERYEVLTVASLVEREARVADEQPTIASVIYNRLDQGVRLQVDATVVYAKGEVVNRVVESDLEIDSPWNTYRVDGLPPTPISGAGEGAIAAAAEPEDTDFLYYVVSDRDTGEHAFAKTLAEHNANVARYRAQRAAEQEGD
ncbi:MAG: endolytic transglycosylase MltG [Nitriliruptorales bacterium]|nr:endolytic transglycosylase MltG [Nitriliruptorales bacterium]